MWAFSLILGFTASLVASQSLLRLSPIDQRHVYQSCSKKNVDSCFRAELDIDLLKKGDSLELPDGTKLMISRKGENSAVFKNEDAEAIFTWDGLTVAGAVHVGGVSWALEGCGEDCFLWIQQKNDWLDETSAPESKNGASKHPKNVTKLLEQGLADTTTEVTYTVMIWYTPEFLASFASESDMNVFVDLVFEETNQGYINSEMPVRVSKLGPRQHPTLVDIEDSFQLIDDFEDSLPRTELLNCADAAALLVNEFNNCGIANFRTTTSCRSFSLTQKSCATGYYSFGHEIGHNFGATHNPEEFTTTSGDGYAHLILPTGSSKYSGYRTILGYNADGHRYRKNYYSNPDVIFPTTGTPTGVTDLSNNARLISSNRFAMAACGTDEPNGACDGGSPSPAPVPSPVPSPTPPSTSCGKTDKRTFLKSLKVVKKVKTSSACQTLCAEYSGCTHFVWKKSKKVAKRSCTLQNVGYKTKKNFVSGPVSCGTRTNKSSSCESTNMRTVLKSLKVVKKVTTYSDCQTLCAEYSGCTYFVWKKSKKVAKRSCTLQNVGYKTKKNFVSGPVSC